MIKKAIVFAAAAACLTSGAAFAQSYDYRSDRNDGYERGTRYEAQERYQDGRYDREYRSDRQVSEHRGYGYGYTRDRYTPDRYDGDRYGRGDQRWSRDYGRSNYGQSYYQLRRGERLSHHWQDRRYVVSDWRAHRLYQPQRGYQWVQAGNDYVLVALATGIIAQVLMNH